MNNIVSERESANAVLHELPPGLWENGSWWPSIRAEIQKEMIKGHGAYVQVLREPPALLRWCLKPWLSFQERRPVA